MLYSPELRKKMVELYLDGNPAPSIAKMLGCSVHPVYTALREHGVKPRPSSEFFRGRSLSLEHRDKLSAVRRGKPFSMKHRRNLSLSLKGRPKSQETKKRMSEAKRGKPSPFKGKPVSKEEHERLINFWRSYSRTPEERKRRAESMIGRHPSEETRLKMSLAHKGRNMSPRLIEKRWGNKYRLGIKHTDEIKLKISQSLRSGKNPSWKGGVTQKNWGLRAAIEAMYEYRKWRSDVYTRDHFACRVCGETKSENLRVYHIKPLRNILRKNGIDNPQQALACAEVWDIYNGVTLCDTCHKKAHDKSKIALYIPIKTTRQEVKNTPQAPPGKQYSYALRKKMVDLYLSGSSTPTIARMLGCSFTVIRSALRERGLTLRTRSEAAKGKPKSLAHRISMAEAWQGKPRSPAQLKHLKVMSDGIKGRPFSPEHRRKIVEQIRARALNPEFRKKLSLAVRRGPESNLWKGGVSAKNMALGQAIRSLFEYSLWRFSVFQRDGFTCRNCGVEGGYLHAHHLKPMLRIISENEIFSAKQAPACKELWDIKNGITLCTPCHKQVHSQSKKSSISVKKRLAGPV